MGLVYPPERIAKGAYPEIGSHELAAEKIMKFLGGYDKFKLYAMIHGSVAMGEAKRRSDLDFLLIYDNAAAILAINELSEELKIISNQFNVSLEPLVISDKCAEDGIPMIDLPYYLYLQESQEQSPYLIGLPVDHIKHPEPSINRQIFRAYVLAKSIKFSRSDTALGISFKDFQRAFELPSAIRRKSSRLFKESFDDFLGFVDRQEAKTAKRSLTELDSLNQDYTNLLEHVIAGETTLKEYEEWLNDTYKKAINNAGLLSLGALALADWME